jgi:hypothetical protein
MNTSLMTSVVSCWATGTSVMGGRKKQAKSNTRISRVLVLSFIDTDSSVAAILALFFSTNFPELVVLGSV